MGKLCQILSKWTGMKATKIDVCIYYKLCIHFSWLHVYLMSCCGWPKRRKSSCHSYIATYTPLSKLWHQWVSNWRKFIFRTRSERFPSLSHELLAPISSCNKNCCEMFWLHFRLNIRHESSAYWCSTIHFEKNRLLNGNFLYFFMSCQTVNGGIFAGASVPRYQKVDRTGDKKENKNRNYVYRKMVFWCPGLDKPFLGE